MLGLLLTYKYLILLPLAVIEGPIITVIAGLFVRTGILNFFIVYIIVIFGDILGDAIAYFVGRFSGPIFLKKFNKFFHITPEKTEKAKAYFDLHHHKTLVLSKIIHGFGIAGLMTAGTLKVPYKKFFITCLCVSLVQSAAFLLLGFFFGHIYVIFGKYMNIFSKWTIIIGIIVVIVLFFYFRLRKK